MKYTSFLYNVLYTVMIRIFLIIVTALYLPSLTYAQDYPSVKDSIVWTQILEGNYIEAIDSYERINGSLHPSFELLYQAFINRILGRYEKSASYFQGLIEGHLGNLDSTLAETCFWAMCTYSERTNNAERLRWLERKLTSYHNLGSPIPLSTQKLKQIQLEVSYALQRLREPIFHYKQGRSIDTLHFDYTHSKIQIPITLNGYTTSATIDTGGTTFLAIHYKTAQKLGIKAKLEQGRFNNVDTEAINIKVDSLCIGHTTFYNVPVNLYNLNPMDTLSLKKSMGSTEYIQVKEMYSKVEQPILGLRLLNQYGSMQIDLPSKQLILKHAEATPLRCDNRPNFFNYNDRLFIPSIINETKASLFIDTGSNETIRLSKEFYNAYHKQLPILPESSDRYAISIMPHRIFPVKLRILNQPRLKIANRELHFTDKNKELCIDDKDNHYGDGVIGIEGLHLLGNKICFDFKNMHLSFED